MKITGLLIFWLAAATVAAAQTSPSWEICRYPVRVFPGGAMVNLTPLFQWWARQPLVGPNPKARSDTNSSPADDRPLSSWYRVTGTRLGDIGASWVLEATIYTSPTVHTNARIILNNPPIFEEQSFDDLKAQWEDAEQRVLEATRVYSANTNAEAQARATEQMYRHSISKVARDGVVVYKRLAVEKQDAAAAALDQVNQLAAARDQIGRQMELIPSLNGTYQIDWFAVLVGKSKQGVPIYDPGMVRSTSP